MLSRIFHILGCCRRIILLLSFLLVASFAWVWWSLPDPDAFRGEIEATLRNQLSLQQLHLGHISWHWRGDLEVRAEDSSLRSADGRWQLQNTRISLRFSMIEWLRGHWLPRHVALENGILRWRRDEAASVGETKALAWPERVPELPSISFSAEKLLLLVQWRDHWLPFRHLSLHVSTELRTLKVRSDALRGLLDWNEDGQIQRVHIDIDDARWLPLPKGLRLEHACSLRARIERAQAARWDIRIGMDSSGAKLSLPEAPFTLPLQRLEAHLELHADELLRPATWRWWRIASLRWQNGKDTIQAHGVWRKQTLRIQARTSHLRMPQLWSWLRVLDDDKQWRAWLKRMRQGTITQARADVSLRWPQPWRTWPPSLEEEDFQYRVVGEVRGADIDLAGDADDVLRQVDAHVEIDARGLDAKITANLPHRIGRVRGRLSIPWRTLMLDIRAWAEDIDGKRLHHWVDPEGAARLAWKRARTHARVHLRWDPEKSTPDFARAEISPAAGQAWRLRLQGRALRVQEGTIVWQSDTGLQAQGVHVDDGLLKGVVDFAGAMKDDTWVFRHFDGRFEVGLAALTRAYHLPVAEPRGIARLQLRMDSEDWRGIVRLNDAGWRNFLGQDKRMGLPLRVDFDARLQTQSLWIRNLRCEGPLYRFRGQARLRRDSTHIEFSQVDTQGFRGSIRIDAPTGNRPWRMQVRADYLRRSALPETLREEKRARDEIDRPWRLQASIARFDWHDAQMRKVELQMWVGSKKTGRFQAQAIDSGGLQLQRVDARFRMPGEGRVTIEHLDGIINGQRLKLAATLEPMPDGGMRWHGIASTQGPFETVMRNALDARNKTFRGGTLESLFAGEGVFMQEQPWWQGLRGRLRLRIDEGSIGEGGLLTKILAITSLADLPALLIGQRKDLTHSGLFYKRLQIESTITSRKLRIHRLAMRSTAMDMAGRGSYDLQTRNIDLMMVFRPLQNLDAILGKIPLLRDLIGGSAHSLMRKVYHLHGPVHDAQLDQVTPSSAGLSRPGLIEGLLTLPDRWFGQMKEKQNDGNEKVAP